MSKTFLELLELLKKAKTRDEKSELTSDLSLSLEENEKYSERLLHSYFTHTIGREVGEGFQDIVRSEFFLTRVRAYIDVDFTTKIAVGVSYLQDSNNFINDLDEKVLESISNWLQLQNLNLLINDVSVNGLQKRNGEKINIEAYHKKGK